MFVGPAGIGKTTLAKYISEKYGIPFISGSMTDLLPATKDLSHIEIFDLWDQKPCINPIFNY